MPRHPPCALHSLSQQRQNNTRRHKLPRNTRPTPNQRTGRNRLSLTTTRKENRQQRERQLHTHNHNPHTRPTGGHTSPGHEDARVHYADLKQQPHQPPHPSTQEKQGRREEQKPNPTPPPEDSDTRRLILQDPTVCSTTPPTNVRLRDQDQPEPPNKRSSHDPDSRRSTSETPPCAGRHSLPVRVCAP